MPQAWNRIWAFTWGLGISNIDNLKDVEGNDVDRLVGGFMDVFFDSGLCLESYMSPHKLVKNRKYKHVVSFDLITKISYIASLFLGPFIKIKNESLISDIVNYCGLNSRLSSRFKKKLVQHVFEKFIFVCLFKLWKPKRILSTFFIHNVSAIWAANSMNIPTFEFQHGIIDKNHFIYTYSKNVGKVLFPSKLFLFGDVYKDIFNSENFFISPSKCISIGNYYSDFIQRSFKKDRGLHLVNSYTRVVLVTTTVEVCGEMLDFIIETAKLDKSILFIFKPRHLTLHIIDKIKCENLTNLVYTSDLNFYELLCMSTYHVTSYSTTALESWSFGVETILMIHPNYKSTMHPLARIKQWFKVPPKCCYSPNELYVLIKNEPKSKEIIKYENRRLVSPGYPDNLETLLL